MQQWMPFAPPGRRAMSYSSFGLVRVTAACSTVVEVHIPDQVSYKSGDGLCVRIDGSELHWLNVWLYEAQQVVGGSGP